MGDKLFFNQNYGITWDWARDQQTAWATSKPYDVVDIFRKEIHLIQAALYVGRNDSCHHLSCGRPKKKACNPLILDIENGRFRRQERTHLARRLRPVKMALLGRSIFSPFAPLVDEQIPTTSRFCPNLLKKPFLSPHFFFGPFENGFLLGYSYIGGGGGGIEIKMERPRRHNRHKPNKQSHASQRLQ